MAIFDDLLKLRSGGTSGTAITATEAGSVTKTRDATTGKAVIEIDKMPAEGLPITLLQAADGGTSNDKTIIVTIEASDVLAFNDSTQEVVITFPTITHGDVAAKYVRLTATQKKYLRSVCTVAGSNGTISCVLEILIGHGSVDSRP